MSATESYYLNHSESEKPQEKQCQTVTHIQSDIYTPSLILISYNQSAMLEKIAVFEILLCSSHLTYLRH